MDTTFHWDVKNKVISRTSSIGCSSRSIYYCGTPEGVPFKWETQPGTPKDPPPQDMLPPLTPPPAVLSLGLPKPCIEQPKTRPRPLIRLRFWRRSKKNGKRDARARTIDYSNEDRFGHPDKLETFSFLSSDCEFMTSSRNSMSSSPSLSLSSSSSPSSFFESLTVRRRLNCNAWQINRILACYHC
ncbi:hypothetical protein SDJN02_17593, partial [Cucurbita argyrosperma subsp. argyrosperma]